MPGHLAAVSSETRSPRPPPCSPSDEAGMRRILRYNRFRTDPRANHRACNQLACRGDLMADPVADGAINAKFTSASRFVPWQPIH